MFIVWLLNKVYLILLYFILYCSKWSTRLREISQKWQVLTPLVQKPEYSGWTRSMTYPLIPRHFASPYQHLWYWLCRRNRSCPRSEGGLSLFFPTMNSASPGIRPPLPLLLIIWPCHLQTPVWRLQLTSAQVFKPGCYVTVIWSPTFVLANKKPSRYLYSPVQYRKA